MRGNVEMLFISGLMTSVSPSLSVSLSLRFLGVLYGVNSHYTLLSVTNKKKKCFILVAFPHGSCRIGIMSQTSTFSVKFD